jgi:hypothetical protein
MVSFALELLIVWLVARNVLLTKEHLALYRNGTFVLLFCVTATLHIVRLEQRRWNHYNIDRLDEEATVLLNSDDEGTSTSSGSINDADDVSIASSVDTGRMEKSSAGSHNVSTNPTERMPFVVLRGYALTSTPHSPSMSSSSSQFNSMNSPAYLNVRLEFTKLLVLVDTLLVSYTFIMLQHDGSINTIMMIVLITTLMCSIGVVMVTYLRRIHDHHGPTTHTPKDGRSFVKGTCSIDDEKRLSFSQSFQTYNSIDV